MKTTIYIVTKFKEYGSTDEKYSWATAESTREAAEKAIRDMIVEDVDADMEGSEDVSEEEYDEIIKTVTEAAIREGEECGGHDAILHYGDFTAYYDIFPTYV